MKFKDYKYERLNYEDIEKDYTNLLNELKSANDVETFKDVFKRINNYRSHLQTMMTLCSIRHSIDTSDSFYDEENDYWDNTSPRIQVFENEFFITCLNVPFRNELNIPDEKKIRRDI